MKTIIPVFSFAASVMAALCMVSVLFSQAGGRTDHATFMVGLACFFKLSELSLKGCA